MTADQQSSTFPDPSQDSSDVARRADALLRGAARARSRAKSRLQLRLADLNSDEATRLDDQVRALCDHHLSGSVALVERDLRESAARLLVARGRAAEAAVLRNGRVDTRGATALVRYAADAPVAADLLARLRLDLIATRLPEHAGDEDEPSLLVRLSEVAQPSVSDAARALLAAESRRREAMTFHEPAATELSAELQHRLVWRVAAILRGAGSEPLDRALADAALQSLAGYDEGERTEAIAMRLALAIDARPAELNPLVEEALNDRRLTLVVAVLAHAAQLSFEQVRDLLIEPDDERWWLLLRSLSLDPLTVARIALALAEADPRRHADALPDLLDALHLVSVEDARAALAALRLPQDFRSAVEALADEVIA